MKAKEYVSSYRGHLASGVEEAMVQLARAIAQDIMDLVKVRKPYSDAAFEGVFKEVKQRFDAARRLEGSIPLMLFSIAVKSYWPKMWPILVRRGVVEDDV